MESAYSDYVLGRGGWAALRTRHGDRQPRPQWRGPRFFLKEHLSYQYKLFYGYFLPNHKKPISCSLKVVRVEALPQKDEYLIGGMFFNIATQDREDISTFLEKMDLYVLLKSAITGGRQTCI